MNECKIAKIEYFKPSVNGVDLEELLRDDLQEFAEDFVAKRSAVVVQEYENSFDELMRDCVEELFREASLHFTTEGKIHMMTGGDLGSDHSVFFDFDEMLIEAEEYVEDADRDLHLSWAKKLREAADRLEALHAKPELVK